MFTWRSAAIQIFNTPPWTKRYKTSLCVELGIHQWTHSSSRVCTCISTQQASRNNAGPDSNYCRGYLTPRPQRLRRSTPAAYWNRSWGRLGYTPHVMSRLFWMLRWYLHTSLCPDVRTHPRHLRVVNKFRYQNVVCVNVQNTRLALWRLYVAAFAH